MKLSSNFTAKIKILKENEHTHQLVHVVVLELPLI